MPRDPDGTSRNTVFAQPEDALVRERDVARAMEGLERRIEEHDSRVGDLIDAAVERAVERLQGSALSQEEREWVRRAVVAAGKREERWEAVIRHGTIVLVFGALALLAQGAWALVSDWLRAHGLKV